MKIGMVHLVRLIQAGYTTKTHPYGLVEVFCGGKSVGYITDADAEGRYNPPKIDAKHAEKIGDILFTIFNDSI